MLGIRQTEVKGPFLWKPVAKTGRKIDTFRTNQILVSLNYRTHELGQWETSSALRHRDFHSDFC